MPRGYDPKIKELALKLLAAGEVTQSEASRLVGVSRVSILNWCKDAQIDATAARSEYLRRQLKRIERRRPPPVGFKRIREQLGR